MTVSTLPTRSDIPSTTFSTRDIRSETPCFQRSSNRRFCTAFFLRSEATPFSMPRRTASSSRPNWRMIPRAMPSIPAASTATSILVINLLDAESPRLLCEPSIVNSSLAGVRRSAPIASCLAPANMRCSSFRFSARAPNRITWSSCWSLRHLKTQEPLFFCPAAELVVRSTQRVICCSISSSLSTLSGEGRRAPQQGRWESSIRDLRTRVSIQVEAR
mmetsp:Transcript_2818/g.3836  ORF Transcript_2818/g.3836 Transcript_2818/m.3836 type:complete len:217 (-) Transcript_2818:961-1611(-)